MANDGHCFPPACTIPCDGSLDMFSQRSTHSSGECLCLEDENITCNQPPPAMHEGQAQHVRWFSIWDTLYQCVRCSTNGVASAQKCALTEWWRWTDQISKRIEPLLVLGKSPVTTDYPKVIYSQTINGSGVINYSPIINSKCITGVV